jgi:hypothetical protein
MGSRARVIAPTGKHRTPANIVTALAGREIAQRLREPGTNTRGPAPVDQEGLDPTVVSPGAIWEVRTWATPAVFTSPTLYRV